MFMHGYIYTHTQNSVLAVKCPFYFCNTAIEQTQNGSVVRKKCLGNQKAKASSLAVSLTECMTMGKLLDLLGL